MVTKETVHLYAVIFWALFGIIIGSISAIHNQFNIYIMVTLTAAIAGNSGHLIALAFSKTGVQITSSQTK